MTKEKRMNTISDSRFHMWRAVTAMVHADSVVKPHEVNFIVENLRTLPFTEAQMTVLVQDLKKPADMEEHFLKITSPRDKEDFFHLAQAIAWSDGEFDEQEQALLDRIRALPRAKNDITLMETALENFRGLYIEGQPPTDRSSMFGLIRELLGAKAA